MIIYIIQTSFYQRYIFTKPSRAENSYKKIIQRQLQVLTMQSPFLVSFILTFFHLPFYFAFRSLFFFHFLFYQTIKLYHLATIRQRRRKLATTTNVYNTWWYVYAIFKEITGTFLIII